LDIEYFDLEIFLSNLYAIFANECIIEQTCSCENLPLPLFSKLIFTHKRGGWTQGATSYAVNMKKSLLFFKFVIPAEAGIQVFPGGPGFPFSRE
jgi:hypothetical protein